MLRFFSLGALTLLAVSAAMAQDAHQLTLTVTAGKHDRRQTPVKVPLEIPKLLSGALIVPLKAESGETIVGQLSTSGGLLSEEVQSQEGTVGRYLHFVLPELAAGKTLTLNGEVRLEIHKLPAVFLWKDSGQYAELSYSRRPVLKYMYAPLDETTPEKRAETYKPYHHVYDPQGKFLVTKGPGGLFPHHRGLFYGFNRISYNGGQNKADTWHCNRGESQQHAAFISNEAGPVFGRHEAQINWHGQNRNVFARERREMTVFAAAGGNLIEFASHLESLVGPLKLDGDPQHAGFQFRATQEVPDKSKDQTYYLRPDGKGERGKFRNWPADKNHVNLPWHALSFVAGGKRYTCCYLDRPENPKEARFSERDYGRFGSYFEYEVTSDKPLEVSYRIWLQEGEMTVEQVQRLASDFVEPPSVTVQ
jgi:hypothetical protein